MVKLLNLSFKRPTGLEGRLVMQNYLTTLSDSQLKQAESIAQYDVESASRYCQIVAAKNQMRCPLCGSQLIRSGGKQFNLVCSRYRGRKHG